MCIHHQFLLVYTCGCETRAENVQYCEDALVDDVLCAPEEQEVVEQPAFVTGRRCAECIARDDDDYDDDDGSSRTNSREESYYIVN
ncbi:hypothetical protein SPI_08101 [Niveomyces insectorum RCEF 264]|uniref:Uncharacterized protein n=1 Tax=Niveomyces insectorum RCEF 264 TaxID=1081102 RepID=A0A167NTE0_9HYPO|nr:hypothetical protein SPI_08101 [Niveomyces insectorum RCEF 264]